MQDRETVRLETLEMLSKLTERPMIWAWLSKRQRAIVEATKRLVVSDDEMIDRLAAMLPPTYLEMTVMADKKSATYKADVLAELKVAAEAKGIDWNKVSDLFNNLALPILTMILEYLKRLQPLNAAVKADGSCDHACCCCECIELARALLAHAQEHCECCVSN